MAFAESLTAAIHAIHQAGELQGRRVLTFGVGPIGCLIVSVVKTLRAAEIVCAGVSSRSPSLGKETGVDVFANPQNDDMDYWKAEKGYSDVSLEMSGHSPPMNTCLRVIRAHGVMVQAGMGGATVEFPMMTLTGKEISLKGSFRFTSEFNTAVSWLANGVINLLSLLSAEYPFTDLEEVLRFAGDKTQAVEVQLVS